MVDIPRNQTKSNLNRRLNLDLPGYLQGIIVIVLALVAAVVLETKIQYRSC